MNQIKVYILYLSVVWAAFFCAPSQAVVLKIATLSPDGSTWMKKLRAGAKEIEKRTEGRVHFKFYPGGVMGQDKAVLRKMRVGQLQGGAFSNGSLHHTYSGVQVYNLVMKFSSYDEVDYVRHKMDPLIAKGLEKNGMVALGLSEIGFAYLMSTKPVATISDLRKQKAWIPENNVVAEQALKAFSMTPIPLPMRDVLIALQTGMVDAVASSPIGAITLQWHTKIKYLTDLPLLYVYGVLVVSEKSFSKVSPDDQNVVREVMGRVSAEMNTLNREDNIAALAAMRKQGVTFIKPTEEAVNELRDLIQVANKNLVDAGDIEPELVQTLDKYLQDFHSIKAYAHE